MHVEASDEGEVLQQKWRSWVEREQWKRSVDDDVQVEIVFTDCSRHPLDWCFIVICARRKYR